MQHALKRFLTLVLLLGGAPLAPMAMGATAQIGKQDPLPAVPGAVREAMSAGDYSEAVSQLAGLRTTQPDDADFWLYMQGLALSYDGKLAEAEQVLASVETEHAGSRWIPKSRFRRAEVLRRMRRFQEAEEIFEEAARHLRSADRQRELARIYLDFADELSTVPDPPQPGQQGLDYARAHALYSRVLDLGAPRDSRETAMFRMGLCRIALQQWNEAATDFASYIAEFDPTRREGTANYDLAETQGRFFQARRKLALALENAGRPQDARRQYEDLSNMLAQAFAGFERWKGSLDSQSDERRGELRNLHGEVDFGVAATYQSGNSYETPLAIAALERFLHDFPNHRRTSRAAFDIGERWRSIGRDEDSIAGYQAFLARPVPQTTDEDLRTEDARLRMRALYLSGWVLARQKRFDQAVMVFQDYTRRYPTGSDWSAAQQGIVDAEYEIGASLRANREFAAAREAWTRFLEAHPLDGRARQTSFDLGQLFVEQAEGIEKQDSSGESPSPLYQSAIDQWVRLVQKYPGTNEASNALWSTGLLYETKLDDLDRAIATYRRCDFGSHAGNARSRLALMTSPYLSLRTERKWLTDEVPRVKVQLRNVEDIEVQVYAIDLEAYFRKHLTHRQIENLDLDLIAADRRFDVKIDDYARYKPLEREIELPVEGPGVWAVAVSAGEERATTLVMRSDIDVVVKSSRREVFVYAQNMRLGAPAEGVRVLCALPGLTGESGGPSVMTAETASDGIARLAFDELEHAGDLRLFASLDGSCASDGLSLSGLQLSAGLAPRGYVYTDRSAYRPGDEVSWRAVLREVSEGSYVFKEGKSYRIEALDSEGRVFSTGRYELSEFGTLHGSIRVAPGAPVGTYSLRCRAASGPVFSGTFQVDEYKLDKVELAFEQERDVYYRGERVEVVAKATYYYGEPVVDSPLRVQLPDGRVTELRTNADGEASFGFDTRDYQSSQVLQFSGTLTEEQVFSSGSAYLAIHGFTATVTVNKGVVLAGDSFQVGLSTHSPDGKPLAQEMKLEILRRESHPDGTWSEVLVDEHALATDVESGEAHQSVALDAGGQYVLRATGVDRFENPVSSEVSIFVSGDDDAVRLRLLTERQHVDVGEQAVVDLHNRAGAGLALVTFEGETILSYRIVPLAEGSNRVVLDVDHEHFPNFTISAAMMRGNEFFTASTDFTVSRQLDVAIETGREVYAPGEQAEIRLRVTDQLGRPVAAELSLAVVDDALYQLFPDTNQHIRSFFEHGTWRESALRTVTSCTFEYDGVTVRISEDILREVERQAAERQWDARRSDMLGALVQLESPAQEISMRGLRDKFYEGAIADEAFDLEEEEIAFNSVIGLGGGAGGQFGGRFGGRRKQLGKGADAGKDFPTETAFWAPNILSGADGSAVVRFRVPEESTRWRVTCRGVGAGTLVGQSTETFVSKAQLFVELRSPAQLVEGDQPVMIARVHNLTGLEGHADLRLRMNVGAESYVLPARVSLGKSPVVEHAFPLRGKVPAVGAISAEVEVSADLPGRTLTDSALLEVLVRPFGVEFADFASGILTANESLALLLPGERSYENKRLELSIGSSVDRMLIDTALMSGRRQRSSLADTAGELTGVCAVMELFERTGRDNGPEYGDLRTRAEGLVATLISAQRSDGGWCWFGRKAESSVEVSSRAMTALAHARDVGVPAPSVTTDRGIQYLSQAFRSAAQQANELKSMLVYAMSVHGHGDFGAANRLHRVRQSLSPAALAYTCLALIEMEREPMAADLASILESKAIFEVEIAACRWPTRGNIAWNRSSLEMTALAVSALQRALPRSERIEAGVQFLLSHRPWHPARARGRALEVLARYQGETVPSRNRLTIEVTVEGEVLEKIELNETQRVFSMDMPVATAGPGARVDLKLTGSGSPHFEAVLRGFSKSVEPQIADNLRIRGHTYLASAPTYRGKTVRTGFTTVRGHDEVWENKVANLPFGHMTRGRIDWRRDYDRSDAQSDADYLELEVPLPAGTRVLEGSVQGNLQSYDVLDGRLVVHIGQVRGSGRVTYTLIGAYPGEYRVLPAMLQSAYEPDKLALSAPGEFNVLSRGAASPDEYRPTPDELYDLGKAHYEAQDFGRARELLTSMYDGWEKHLRDDPLRQAATMLLFMSIDAADSSAIVRYFEVLKEKNPELVIPFEKVLAVGEAYRDLEEYERALLIFRATIEETFGKDLKVAGALEEQGEFVGSVNTLAKLWLEFPDLPAVVETSLALSDKLLTKAPHAHEDPELRKAGLDRAGLSLEGILLLQRFLALYPEDPLAADASLNLVSAYLSLEDYETAARLAGEMAGRFTDPRYADAFQYTRAVAEWHLGRNENATSLLQRIADAIYTDSQGLESKSQNRDLAIYILGQIHHAKRDFAKATEYYEEVEDLFIDAKEVLSGFRAKHISLEEVTTARPGEAVPLEVNYRNVEEAELLVYAVDLMTLYLREKNLSSITQVNLAGISPTIRRTVKLPGSSDLRPQDTTIDLALDKAGAYLVICRADALHTSGLVLVSDLELDVKEDPASGRMRVQAMNREDGRYLRDVDVRVIGSASSRFITGRTDPRGMFVADAIEGRSTVIARQGDRHFAFHRGSSHLGAPVQQVERGVAPTGGMLLEGDGKGYFQNVLDLNEDNQSQREQKYKNELSRKRTGVQVKQVR